MISRRVVLNLVAFVLLFVVLASWAVRNVVKLDQIERPYTIIAEFESSPGLQPNVEATYLGVSVGSIERVELGRDHVRVEIDINRGIEIPQGISAAVRRKSAVGEPYIALDPPADPTNVEPIDPDDEYTIPLERTSIPLSYGQLFASVDKLVSAVPPDEFGTMLRELANGLEGRGPRLRELIASASDFTTTLASRTEELDALASDLTSLTHTLASQREGIGSAFDDLALLSDTLAASSADLGRLMAEAPAFGEEVQRLLDATYSDLSCMFPDIGALFRTIGSDARIADLVSVFRVAAQARDSLNAALVEKGQDGADGPYLGGSFGIVVDDPPQAYATPVTLPDPPAILGCDAPNADGTFGSGDGSIAGAGDGASGVRDGRVDVPARRVPGAPDLPDSTTASVDAGKFPLGTIAALAGGALLLALLVALRPWRWWPLAGRSDSGDDD